MRESESAGGREEKSESEGKNKETCSRARRKRHLKTSLCQVSCVHVRVCLCVYVCRSVGMHAWMDGIMSVCMSVCLHACVHGWTCARM